MKQVFKTFFQIFLPDTCMVLKWYLLLYSTNRDRNQNHRDMNPMKRYTRPFDIHDHPDYRDDDEHSFTCEYCGERYNENLIHRLHVDVCDDCLPQYVKNELEYEDHADVDNYVITINVHDGQVYGFHFKHKKNPLTRSFTVPTLEDGIKKII